MPPSVTTHPIRAVIYFTALHLPSKQSYAIKNLIATLHAMYLGGQLVASIQQFIRRLILAREPRIRWQAVKTGKLITAASTSGQVHFLAIGRISMGFLQAIN